MFVIGQISDQEKLYQKLSTFIRTYNNVMSGKTVFLRKGSLLPDCEKRIEIMEKEILYYAGRKRALARRKYFRLLKSCNKEIGLEEPIYLKRR